MLTRVHLKGKGGLLVQILAIACIKEPLATNRIKIPASVILTIAFVNWIASYNRVLRCCFHL